MYYCSLLKMLSTCNRKQPFWVTFGWRFLTRDVCVNQLFVILLLICLLLQGLQPKTQKVKRKFSSPPSARPDTVGVGYWGPACPAVTTDALSLVSGQTAFVWSPLCYFPPHSSLVCPNCGSGLLHKFLVVPWFSRWRFKNSPESRWLGWNLDTLFSLF